MSQRYPRAGKRTMAIELRLGTVPLSSTGIGPVCGTELIRWEIDSTVAAFSDLSTGASGK